MNGNPLNHPPAVMARFDQADAMLDAELDRYLSMMREEIARAGAQQAGATFALTLRMLRERAGQAPELAEGILSRALIRIVLAEGGAR